MYSFQRERDDKKRDILFIHGYASTGSSFNKLKKYDRTFNIIAISLPFDQTINNHELSIETYIAYVNEFVKQEQLQDFDVVGHSLGGAVALGIKGAKRAILIAPFNPFVENKEEWLFPKNNDDSLEAVKNIIYEYKNHWNNNIVNFMAKNHFNFIKDNSEFLIPLVEKQIMNKEYQKGPLMDLFKSRDFIIIGGSNDQYVSIDSMRKTTKTFNGKLVKIKSCGHSPVYEKPELVIQIIKSILGTEDY